MFIISAAQLLDSKICPACSRDCEKADRFCRLCGFKQIDVSPEKFLEQYGRTELEYFQMFCSKGHPMDVDDLVEKLKNPPHLYCDVCGDQILKMVA